MSHLRLLWQASLRCKQLSMFMISKVSYHLSLGHISMHKSRKPFCKKRKIIHVLLFPFGIFYPQMMPVLMWSPIFCLTKPVPWNLLITDTFSTRNMAVFLAFTHKMPVPEVPVCPKCLASEWQDCVY